MGRQTQRERKRKTGRGRGVGGKHHNELISRHMAEQSIEHVGVGFGWADVE